VSSAWLALAAVLLLAGTAAAGSVPRLALRIEERVLVGVVSTVLVGAALTYVVALVAGLNPAAVLGGDALTCVCFLAPNVRRRHAVAAEWRRGWAELRSAAERRHRLGLVLITVGAVLTFTLLFAHTLRTDESSNVTAGFETVWADWAQHLTTLSSFATGHNLPPHDSLFSGQDLRYPFLPDFQSATLVTLGASPAVALALPGALLATCITLLVVTLAVRLGAGATAGVIAAAVCLVGGGLGFTGVLADACLHHGFSADQCTWAGFLGHPGDIPSIVTGTLHDLPGIIAAQPRAYDGLLSPSAVQPISNQQWYTPLFAWWLPQRSILYGFSGALVVLSLVVAAARAPRRGYESFALSGLLLGLMPLVHIHTLIAMTIVLAVLALRWHHRGWWITLAVAATLALPRLLTLLAGPHGSSVSGNLFPTLEPGWMYLGGGGDRPMLSPSSLVGAVGGLLRAVVSPQYWGFWILNTGVAVPLCVVVAAAAAAHRLRGPVGSAARRVTALFPADVVTLALASGAVFMVANLVVFQSWDWDNTKLFTYWYLGFGLLLGTLVVRWWDRRWRRFAALATASTVLLTGVVVLLRLLPWTPAADAVGGPYTTATAADIRVAGEVAAATPANAVFLTEGRPNDPLLMFAGRTAVMGYYGWLWSYGTDFGTRYGDVRTMLEGCAQQSQSTCAVFPLLRRYGVGFAEIDDRLTAPGVVDAQVDLGWWAAQGFPVVARSDHVVVYDVRGR
jgi:hypothetical protein